MIKLKHRPETLEQDNDLVKEWIESLPNSGSFYDLGACVGTYSVLASLKGMDVYSFEVDKVNYNAMVENFEVCCQIQPKHFNIGIADKKRRVTLRVGQGNIGGHHKTLDIKSFCGHPNATQHNEKIKIDVNSLDNIIQKNNLVYPDYIKVDIDGSEYAFIQGAKQSLKNAKSICIELYSETTFYKKIMDKLIYEFKFKLVKKGIDLEANLNDYIFEK